MHSGKVLSLPKMCSPGRVSQSLVYRACSQAATHHPSAWGLLQDEAQTLSGPTHEMSPHRWRCPVRTVLLSNTWPRSFKAQEGDASSQHQFHSTGQVPNSVHCLHNEEGDLLVRCLSKGLWRLTVQY